MRTIFILVPSPHPTGPVKGAFALANALAPLRRVVLVFLKSGPGADAALDKRVEVVSLAPATSGWRARVSAYRDLLRKAGGRNRVGSVSMCLSADWVNRHCRKEAVTCSSVRGNLFENYRFDYGWPGVFLAIWHLRGLRAFDHVIAMTEAMARQIRSAARIRAEVIGNFVDEAALEHYRDNGPRVVGPLRIVFVGSLSRRKQPDLVINAMEQLQAHGAQLEVLGVGPLHGALEALIVSKGLEKCVRLHGHIANPYPIVASADVFVLPSRSEGVSRAALEALYLGVPCVLRDADGNGELLAHHEAGALFSRDEDLSLAILRAADLASRRSVKASLLPPAFQQSAAARHYLGLLEQ